MQTHQTERQICTYILKKDLNKKDIEKAIKYLIDDLDKENVTEMCGMVYQQCSKGQSKYSSSYQVLDAMSPLLLDKKTYFHTKKI